MLFVLSLAVYYICVHAVRGWLSVWIGLTNILFIDPSQYKFYLLLLLLYGITHGIDITLDLLLMAWNFKEILRFFFRIV